MKFFVCTLSYGDISNDLDEPQNQLSRSQHFWSRISEKRCILDKVTIAQEETIPNVWNGTMFGDLDWPLNASRRFVSISWASYILSFMFAVCCRPVETGEQEGPRKKDVRTRARPLYDIPYMFEAREFLRKKLIGKKVTNPHFSLSV